jgi:hypothetical protein
MTPIPPPRPKPRPLSQLPLLDVVPVTRDKSLYCPMCVGYKQHHPIPNTEMYRCRVCGRERKDNK